MLAIIGCQGAEETAGRSGPVFPDWNEKSLFQALSPQASGVEFANDLAFDPEFNIYTYRNYYNGGGVAMGDVDNDGLTDLYFSGNLVQNELYLNQGDLNFKVATQLAGVAGKGGWSTGVSMADVNGDGWLDIYVCNSGALDGDDKRNEFFINQQDGTFKEVALDWGIADAGYGTHGVFFDYDRDGDLDLYLLNNSYQAIGSFNLQKNERPKRDSVGGDKLFRNELINQNGISESRFTDVSAEAGIYGSVIGFGLGVTVGDVNKDGWQDIYVSNDFFERDYLYLNQTDGTFREVLTQSMNSISVASMGADMADINNDGYGEIFVTEMLPESNERIKTATTFENWNRYQYGLKNDYYHQFTRNMLQRNNGDGTFSEIGRLSGVEATDWSWGALIFDMDNDGYKDLFVANGIYQDLTNRDFLDFIAAEETKKSIITEKGVDFKALVDAIPSNPVANYAYRNTGPEGDYRFEKVSTEFGLDFKWFSNGSAYGDLDNDGDLDLVINNTNAPAIVYRNHGRDQLPDRHYLQLKFKGTPYNTAAIGTQATITIGNQQQYLEFMPMRGFESTIDGKLHFGLGAATTVDKLEIRWPDGSYSSYKNLPADQLLELDMTTAERGEQLSSLESEKPLLERVMATNYGLDFVHRENLYSDFDQDPLLFHMLSAESPKLCQGDFNGDGQPDIYVGGSKGQAGGLYLYHRGSFRRVNSEAIIADKGSEDGGCACFDADGDGDDDLYVTSGSSEFSGTNTKLLDRLYFNEGGGNKWSKSSQYLPTANRPAITSVVAPYDVDGDGDLDLFVGGRMRPGIYAAPTDSYLLLNDGKGKYTNTNDQLLKELGMVTAALWIDLNQDGKKELAVVGEWMAPRFFTFANGSLLAFDNINLPPNLEGWYNTLSTADLDGNDFPDLILGNHGLNSRFRATPDAPVVLHLNDFDQNGKAEQIISTYQDGKAYPLALLHDLNKQLPGLRKRYLKYATFGDQGIEDIFDTTILKRSLVLKANELRSLLLLNNGKNFTAKPLPVAAQESPLYAITAVDVDGDGDQDIITGGNFYYAKPEVGRYDADRGDVLLNDGRGKFTVASNSGLNISGEVRGFSILQLKSARLLLVARNNEAMEVYKLIADGK